MLLRRATRLALLLQLARLRCVNWRAPASADDVAEMLVRAEEAEEADAADEEEAGGARSPPRSRDTRRARMPTWRSTGTRSSKCSRKRWRNRRKRNTAKSSKKEETDEDAAAAAAATVHAAAAAADAAALDAAAFAQLDGGVVEGSSAAASAAASSFREPGHLAGNRNSLGSAAAESVRALASSKGRNASATSQQSVWAKHTIILRSGCPVSGTTQRRRAASAPSGS